MDRYRRQPSRKDVVQLHNGQTRRKRRGAVIFVGDKLYRSQCRLHMGTPVIEITGDNQGCTCRNFPLDKLKQLNNLPNPTGPNKPEMDHDDMDHRLANLDLDMQKSPLFEAVVRHILVLMIDDRPARQQGVAVFTMPGDCIGPVNRLITQGGQKISLCQVWPMRETAGMTPVYLSDFLQTDHVRIQLLNGMTQIVDFEPLPWSDPLNALMNVVGRYTQG